MNAIPPSFGQTPSSAGATQVPWAALADAGRLVADLAGIEAGRASPREREIPALIRAADPWRRARAEEGVADLVAVMECGLAALLAVNARGTDPRPAARALWREFVAAREAIATLLPPPPAG